MLKAVREERRSVLDPLRLGNLIPTAGVDDAIARARAYEAEGVDAVFFTTQTEEESNRLRAAGPWQAWPVSQLDECMAPGD